MKRYSLEAKKRELVGRKIKKLRQEGILPATVYGKELKSVTIQVDGKEFAKVFHQAGQTGLVDLKVGSETHPSLIKNLQHDGVSGKTIHVEFHKVNLTEKIVANVPVELVGESPAVRDGVGILLQTLNEIEVEALPTDLPEKIEVDISTLSAVDQQVTVAKLAKINGVEFKATPESVVVRVAPAVSEEAKKEAEAEAAAAAAASAEGVPEGQTPESGGEEAKPEAVKEPAETKEPAEKPA